jgi:hypothetical protein
MVSDYVPVDLESQRATIPMAEHCGHLTWGESILEGHRGEVVSEQMRVFQIHSQADRILSEDSTDSFDSSIA